MQNLNVNQAVFKPYDDNILNRLTSKGNKHFNDEGNSITECFHLGREFLRHHN